MNVELTFLNEAKIIGKTSDSGFLIEFNVWSGPPFPAGNILQIQVSNIKYWQEYSLEKETDAS